MSALDIRTAATLAAYAERIAKELSSAVSTRTVKLAADAAEALGDAAAHADLPSTLRATVEDVVGRAGGPFADAEDRAQAEVGARSLARQLRDAAPARELRIPRASVPESLRDDPFAVLPRLGDEEWADATSGQRALTAVDSFVGAVMNGGFEQFFSSSTGDVWEDAVAGAEHLGWPTLAAVLREAGELLPGGAPATRREERAQQIEALTEDVFCHLEDRLDALLGEGDGYLHRLLAYIDTHPDEFFLPDGGAP